MNDDLPDGPDPEFPDPENPGPKTPRPPPLTPAQMSAHPRPRPHPRPAATDERAMRPEQKRLARALRWLVDQPQGRDILREILRPLKRPSFDDNPLRMAHAEGRREFAAEIYENLQAVAPEGLIAVEREEITAAANVHRNRWHDSDDSG